MEQMAQGENSIPIYRRIADKMIREIVHGQRPPGQRLPTVRSLAGELGLSQGTAKHVYDVLEREGYVIKEQGRGTFVKLPPAVSESGKVRAMAAIDRLLDEMQALSFSWQETRIFLDLKLREREQEQKAVRISVVDCNPESLYMMREQILALQQVEVDSYLLDAVLSAPKEFAPQSQLVVTTTTHGSDLEGKLQPGQKPTCLVMSLRADTAVELAAIPTGARVGIICKSQRFAQIALAACKKYCKANHPIQTAFLGDAQAVQRVVENSEVLILAPNHHLFSSGEEAKYLHNAMAKTKCINCLYQLERGSLVYLESQVKSLSSV